MRYAASILIVFSGVLPVASAYAANDTFALITETNGLEFGVTHGLTFDACFTQGWAKKTRGNAATPEEVRRAKIIFACADFAPPVKAADPQAVLYSSCLPDKTFRSPKLESPCLLHASR